MYKKILSILNGLYTLILSSIYHFKKPFIKTGKYSIKYLVDTRSALDFHIIRYGILNDFIGTHLSSFVKKDSIVFDVGANVGLLSLPFAKEHVPEGRVFAYEPDEQNHIKLKTNIELNSPISISPLKKALQDKNDIDSLSFFIRRSMDSDGNNNLGLSSLGNPGLHTKEEVKVEASTLDKEVILHKIDHLDFIKIDVEGFEYEVLLGGEESIKKYKPIIQYELSTVLDDLLKKQNCLHCFEYMKQLGYTQYQIVNEQYLVELKIFSQSMEDCNVLCFPKKNIPETIKKFLR